MEENLIITLPKTNKVNGLITLRAKKYIRVYSARRNPSREATQRQLKNVDLNSSINPHKTSHEASRQSFRPTSIYYLQQTSKSLLYDIQKAGSDKSELIRDISTYDYNFSNEKNLFTTLHKLNSTSKGFPESVELLKQSSINESLHYEDLNQGLTKFHKIKPIINLKPESFTEDFGVKKVSSAHLQSNVFQGSTTISGIYSIISLISDKWLENLTFKVQTLDGLNFGLQMTQTMSNSFYSSAQLVQAVKSKLLPFLVFRIEKSIISLHFDPSQGINMRTFLIQLKGHELCNVIAIIKSLTHIILDVPDLEHSLSFEVPEEMKDIIKDQRKLAREIQNKLMYCKKKKTLLWGKTNTLFESSEVGSRFFDENYVKSTMDLEQYNQLYVFDYPKYNTRIACFEYKDRNFLRISCDRECAEIDAKSKHYAFLQDMQSFSMTRSPKTLASSLELEVILIKMFPRLSRKSQNY
ncbi:hypothetical protein SteCoe_11080 [Stentor coeruleus]|uniref:Uncharacterized protein n=1 Tax=Stentor coeruleus TaxID=5963 RepID=A0A1R2CDZ4_9CILI|nr:hypothetical protein SteCoe_11080 [Stentor coeruleus]